MRMKQCTWLNVFLLLIWTVKKHFAYLLNVQPKIISKQGNRISQFRHMLPSLKEISSHIPSEFHINSFHHVELYTTDAATTSRHFMNGLGMNLIAKSDYTTGNMLHSSHLIQSGDIKILFTAPYPSILRNTLTRPEMQNTLPNFEEQSTYKFLKDHGLAVKTIAITTDDVISAYDAMIQYGAEGVSVPTALVDATGKGTVDIAEVKLYGDVTLRILNTNNYKGTFLPNFQDVHNAREAKSNFGLQRFDHIVGNVWKLDDHVQSIKSFTGFHEFAEFSTDDVGTKESGLNSVVLANTNEFVLLPLNEPTFGTKRKSQIQTYLEYNQGAGVQHLALLTDNIFATLEHMQSVPGGFEFLDPPSSGYYDRVVQRLGNKINNMLSAAQFQLAKRFGVLIDADEEGILLQIFTKPVTDRPTLFFEIIQRIGCMKDGVKQKAGCGGFGKGNFKDLFQSIEDYENKLGINKIVSN